MNNRTSFYIVMGIIALAAIGIISQLITDPGSFIKMLVITAVVVAVIYFLINRFAFNNQANPSQKHEQHAFKKAAKKSKKRFQKKENTPLNPKRSSSVGSLSAARKKKRDASHLKVIDGKKGKKKNRVSF